MIILVIRHGESEADILDVHEGRADFELTQKGHQQAAAMAKYVAGNYRLAMCGSIRSNGASRRGFFTEARTS